MPIAIRTKRLFARFWHGLRHGRRLPICAGLLLTYLVFLLFNSNQPGIRDLRERLDNMVYDQRFNRMDTGGLGNQHKIVIVDYDQRSLEAEGQWPWSRFKLGDLVTRLADHGVLVVGFDAFFPEYERNLVSELEQRIQSDAALAGTASGELLAQLDELTAVLDGDRYFADSMQATDVVLGFSFMLQEGVRSGILPDPVFRISATESASISLDAMQGYIGNVDVLQKGASGGGFFDTVPDVDGIIRRYPLIMQHENRIYPSLALDMARLYYFEDEFTPDIEADLTGMNRELQGIFMGQVRIPTDEQGEVLIPYIGPSGSFPYISASDVLRGTLTAEQEELLFNSLVLIGTTSTGLYDLRATPVQSVYPGVEVHANVLNAILGSSPSIVVDGSSAQEEAGAFSELAAALEEGRASPFPSRPDWEVGAVRMAILAIGIGLSLIYPYLGPAMLGLSSITFMVGLSFLNFHLWSSYRLDISLVILLLLILLITVLNMTYGFLKEGLNKRAIKGMFDQYVAPAHIDAMLNDPDKYNFDGESKELSVLFSDIRDFTAISEKLSATELKGMLNDFFTPITGVIFEHNGTIDKYVGDMVMAFWGAPLDDPDHRTHAVRAALKMLAKAEDLKAVFAQRGLPQLDIGIGINSGVMSVGDMGSTYRRSYTVLGDAVNLGSRLESLTKVYGARLLIGEQTHAGLQGILCRLVDKVQVKGKERSLCIYQPLCETSEASAELLALLAEYQQAYDNYLQQHWDSAAHLFRQLRMKDPDTRLYAIYLQRIADLRGQHLPENWDGTFRHGSK